MSNWWPRDSTKLAEFGRIAEAVKSENPKVKTLVRAHSEIEDVGQPVQAYNMQIPYEARTAVLYPVDLKSGGRSAKRIWVEVTTLASMAFDYHKLDEKEIVREFVAEQLSKGGASYLGSGALPAT